MRIVTKKLSIQGKKEDFVRQSTSNTDKNLIKADVADENVISGIGNHLSSSSFNHTPSSKLEAKGIIIIYYIFFFFIVF